MAEYLGKLHVPESAYLPPPAKAKGVHMTPPASNYENPLHGHMTKLHPPSKGYLPPKEVAGYELQPPNKGYLPPKEGYQLQPPNKGYLPPKEGYQLRPPDKGYLPPKELTGLLPELASYLSPISEYMASMLPPQKDYSYDEKIKPPSKGRLAQDITNSKSAFKIKFFLLY